jgi:hypothetical protein
MQPTVQEHGAVACAEDEPVTVHPRGLIGIEDHGMAVEHRAELSASEGQSKVAAGALVNGVHGQAARFIGCACKIGSRHGVRHIRKVVLRCSWRAAHFEDTRAAPDMPCMPQPLAHVSSSGKCDRLRRTGDDERIHGVHYGDINCSSQRGPLKTTACRFNFDDVVLRTQDSLAVLLRHSLPATVITADHLLRTPESCSVQNFFNFLGAGL